MSNPVLFDPLLTEYLAGELDQLMRGRACAAAPLFMEERAALLRLDGGAALRFDLHPARGWVRIVPAPADVPADAVCASVEAVPDERLLHVHIDVDDRFRARRRTLTIELHTNQWNAILHEEGRIVSILWKRRAGSRDLSPGRPYLPPPGDPRFGIANVEKEAAREVWFERLGGSDPQRRRPVLLADFACTGTINAGWILGADADAEAPSHHSDALDAAFERWWWLRGRPPPEPSLLHLERGPQPYPLHLSGIPAQQTDSLLAAMDSLADREPIPERPAGLEPARRLVTRELTAARRRLQRFEQRMDQTAEIERLRSLGDLILARIDSVPRGEPRAVLEDWEGQPLEVELDARLAPAENAARYYDEARRRGRAADQLPALIEAARDDIERWTSADAELNEGSCPDWLGKLLTTETRQRPSAGSSGTSLPYRVFRTSGGLEIRLGRSARDNDRLTFHASRPDDVWLHARSVPGSHVILRWSDPVASPPARDLHEAAQLAAVFSRSRTSSTVAVDWTRRKHVRKPRGAAPGLVVPQRVKTLFVEPDEAVVERLAVEQDPGAGPAAVNSGAFPPAPDEAS